MCSDRPIYAVFKQGKALLKKKQSENIPKLGKSLKVLGLGLLNWNVTLERKAVICLLIMVK